MAGHQNGSAATGAPERSDPTAARTVVVITGASRGLGRALTEHYLAAGAQVLAISRRAPSELAGLAQGAGGALNLIEGDLSLDAGIETVAAQIRAQLANLALDARRDCILINNAGAVDPVNVVDKLDDARAITRAFCLNVTAPIALTSAVLSQCGTTQTNCRILNISSGAGRNPTSGWTVYCATKAALDMATRVLNAEGKSQSVRAVALAPGVLDTDMQYTLRSKEQADFPARHRFVALHADGKLSAPQHVAARIAHYLNQADFGATEIDDIRHYDKS